MAADNFRSISIACSSPAVYTVLGVVVDTLPIFRTKGSSKCVTFTIKDSHFDLPSWSGGLKVKYFSDDDSHIPNVKIDDVVLLRNIKVAIFQNKPTGISGQNQSVSWIICRPESTPNSNPVVISTGPVPFEPTLWEQHQAQSLLDRVSAKGSSVQQPTPHSVPGPRQITHVQASRPAAKVGLPFCLIKDAEPHRLYKLLGQVVKLNTYDSEKTLLYITDYTENPLLPDKRKPGEEDDTGMEGDRYSYLGRKNDWPGPWGRLTIQVALWEPHAGYAREHISKDDLVLLTYVRMKQSRDLEASVHQDRIYPEKIHVQVFRDKNDERVQALMARRAEYWEIHGEPKKDTKKTKKKSQAQKKEACKEEGQLTLPAATRTKMNPHVKTKAYTAPVFPLEKILLAETHKNNGPGGVVYQLPFQNVTYRSQIKVIDFFPSKVEDFTVQTTHAPLFNTDNSPAEPRYGWEWRFCLLVEGIGSKSSNQQAREPVKIYVFGEGGEHLLDRSASDLRGNPKELSLIKDRLFHLWGDLEEQKSQAIASGNQNWEAVKSVPFNCCIKEYGVPCTHVKDSNAMDIDDELCSHTDCFGWERRFAIFDTIIHAP